MNWEQIKSDWKHVCDQIKVTWGKLSENDLFEAAGNRKNLVILLEQRYGYAHVLAESKVDDFAQRLTARTHRE